jgi:hypothetical protein
MKMIQLIKKSPNFSISGSALILVLLITALLSTIVVSFLSTSRVEQMASQNFSRQNASSGLADYATQEAIYTLQTAFNNNGTMSGNYTSIVTSQPGRIQKFFFQNGNYSKNASTDLFYSANSSNATSMINLNNLANASTSPLAGLITGNANEAITVYMREIKNPSGNQTLGRVAYYIDDEATKVNLNAASSNRTSLNAGELRPLSLFGANITNSKGLSTLDTMVAATTSDSSSITNWSHFFRLEQATGSGVLSKKNLRDLASVTTATPSGNDSVYTKTPWGSDMLCINTLSYNATDGSGDMSVLFMHEALSGNKLVSNSSSGPGTSYTVSSTYSVSGQAITNIFGGNFVTKYSSPGVKQIAANMLQMRNPDTATVTASFAYNGPLLGSSNLDTDSTIPREYLGFAPYPVVSEVSMDVCYNNSGGNNTYLRPYVRFNVELYNPYPVPFNAPNATLEYNIRGLTWNMSYTINSTGQSFGPHRYGGYGNWTDNSSSKEHWSRADLRDRARSNTQFPEAYFSGWTPWGAQGISIPAYSKVKYNLAGPNWGTYGQALLGNVFPFNASDITITSFTDVRCAITYVRILANSTISTAPPNPNTVRDWVIGAEVGPFIPNNGDLSVCGGYLVWKGGGHQMIPVNTPIDFPRNGAWAEWLADNNNISKYSYQRLCPLIKTSIAASSNLTASTRAWTENASTANQTFGNVSSAALQTTSDPEQLNDAKANPNYDSGNTIPSDPSYQNRISNAVFANATLTNGTLANGINANDMRIPELPSFSGNYLFTCPADLGLVPTNQRWRRLRMQPQPSSESAAGLIPDWAMLDLMAFNDTGYRPSGNMTSWSLVASENQSYTGTGTYNVAYGANGKYAYKSGVTGTIVFNNTTFGDPILGVPKSGYLISTVSLDPTIPITRPFIKINPNGKFHVASGSSPAPRTIGLKALLEMLNTTKASGTLANPITGIGSSASNYTISKNKFMGGNIPAATNVVDNIANMTWSSKSEWSTRRNVLKFPSDTFLLPSEVCEIAGVADVVDQTNYSNTANHFKWNEGRMSAILPALSTCSSFFSIYAYAQVLDKAGNVESEKLTKTIVEVEVQTPATAKSGAQYKFKKLYTQNIPMN